MSSTLDCSNVEYFNTCLLQLCLWTLWCSKFLYYLFVGYCACGCAYGAANFFTICLLGIVLVDVLMVQQCISIFVCCSCAYKYNSAATF